MKLFEYKGKQYDLRFTYKSIVYLEGAFQKPYMRVVSEAKDSELLYRLFWACTRHLDDFKHVTPVDCLDIIDEIIVHGTTTYNMLQSLVQEAFIESVYVKQFLESVQDATPSEGEPGEGE